MSRLRDEEGRSRPEWEVRPESQENFEAMARESGESPSEVVQDTLIGHFAAQAYVRETLDRRYDDLESGRLKPMDEEESFPRANPPLSARQGAIRSPTLTDVHEHLRQKRVRVARHF